MSRVCMSERDRFTGSGVPSRRRCALRVNGTIFTGSGLPSRRRCTLRCHVTHMNESRHTYRQWTAITPPPRPSMPMSTACSRLRCLETNMRNAPKHPAFAKASTAPLAPLQVYMLCECVCGDVTHTEAPSIRKGINCPARSTVGVYLCVYVCVCVEMSHITQRSASANTSTVLLATI